MGCHYKKYQNTSPILPESPNLNQTELRVSMALGAFSPSTSPPDEIGGIDDSNTFIRMWENFVSWVNTEKCYEANKNIIALYLFSFLRHQLLKHLPPMYDKAGNVKTEYSVIVPLLEPRFWGLD